MNLDAFRDNFKAIKGLSISTTAKFVGQTMLVLGVRNAPEIVEHTGLPRSTVYRALAELFQAAGDEFLQAIPNRPTSPTDEKHSEISVSLVSPVGISPVSLTGICPDSASRVEETNLLTNLETTVEINTPLPPKAPTPAEALVAFEAYNETALRCGLAQARACTPERRKKIQTRLREVGGLDGWMQALANIERSSYLTGGNKDGWRADLKFLLRPDNFHKVYEGGYGNGRHARISARPVTYHEEEWMAEARRNLS
jgi:hypothetical protein